MATGVRVIYEPMDLVTGGVSGFAIIVRFWTKTFMDGGIPLWLTNAIVNIPLFIFGWFMKGKRYIIRSLFATIVFTVELSLIPEISIVSDDYVMAAISGGVFMGVGLGLVVLTGSSTGGTDLLSAIIRRFVPHFRSEERRVGKEC